MKEILKDYFEVGKLSLEKIFEYLIQIGFIGILLKSIAIGFIISRVTTYNKTIEYTRNGLKHYTSRPVENVPLGIAVGVVIFFVSLIIWKLFIELLYKVLSNHCKKN